MQIVISRYNEDLEWLKQKPFSEYPVIVYNKGPNDEFYHAPNIVEIIPLPNVGKCDHTYLHHCVSKYENLDDITIFLPGSANLHNKWHKCVQQVQECARHKNTVFLSYTDKYPNVRDKYENFVLEEWKTSDAKNLAANPASKTLPASTRPFGKWYDEKFPGIVVQHVSYMGVLGISKHHILQHPKEHYANLAAELDTHPSPEAGHFIERSWAAIFHPLDDAVFI